LRSADRKLPDRFWMPCFKAGFADMQLKRKWAHLLLTLLAVILLAWMFAHVEIERDGADGWAKNLPTWRIEEHWLLDVFWGGRAMTGYHAWVFPFIALFFHFPLVFFGRWTWQAECRVLACIMLFWLVEDFLWFVLNPAYGLARFHANAIAWHKHWLWWAPVDYWIFSVLMLFLFRLSFCEEKQ
jgi:hypothetical protein